MSPQDPGLAFAALSDATRRDILSRLALGDATVLELAAPFAVSLPAISRHLKVLEQAGLIGRRKDGRHRPCYLRPEALSAVSQWAEFTRRTWEERFDRLSDHLAEMKRHEAHPTFQLRKGRKPDAR